jgi:NADH dehydrogenase [ubiquinone] 1 alpha subcomplex assembly factor 7
MPGAGAPDLMPGPTTPLAVEIARLIAHDGPMSLARYMELCLGHPVHGFYMRGDPFGAAGHFVTAPEVSQMFGELIGLWCGTIWASMGAPDPVVLVEAGPGRGTLMADLLRAAGKVPGFRDALHAHLVETSPALRRRQRETLTAYAGRVAWHERLEEVPPGPAIVVANEFLDALPVRQFMRTERGWCERVVGLGPDGALALGLAADPVPATTVPVALRDGPVGSLAETSSAVRDEVFRLAARLVAHGGAALLVDYGYSRPAHGDTLQAVRKHRFAGLLDAPGESDLTAHVSFAAVADAARAAGAAVHGPLSQARFLGGLGLGLRARTLSTARPDQAGTIDEAVRRLTDPAQMGELFQAMVIASPDLPVPPPFAPEFVSSP